ncbi:MAG: rhodanese-like domain-containing protein [Flavobacterium sp.]|nr:rhodanese-like domain-containing protein [Flavobacterium sp.]
MQKWLVFFIILITCTCFSQDKIADVLAKYNDNSVKYVYPLDLLNTDNIVYLDAREKSEFDVSHIKNSIYVGFEKFNLKKWNALKISKNKNIVVYCSLGVRSEKIAKKIIAYGYNNVSNLYGGIFLWKNSGGIVVDKKNNPTENVHAFSKSWGRYLTSGIKIYN